MCKCFISHSHFHVLKAPIIAELAGYGLSGDAYHISSPSVDGDGAVRAMRTAIADANMVENLDDISYVNAHATSTPTGDVIEANAISCIFKGREDGGPFVTSTKGATGHMLGAAGAIEAAFTALSVRDNKIPPTLALESPDPTCANLRHVSISQGCLGGVDQVIGNAMSNSFGFGGTNSSLVFRKFRM